MAHTYAGMNLAESEVRTLRAIEHVLRAAGHLAADQPLPLLARPNENVPCGVYVQAFTTHGCIVYL